MSIQFKRGDANYLSSLVFKEGELIIENPTDVYPRFKFGRDSTTSYKDLAYAAPDPSIYKDTSIADSNNPLTAIYISKIILGGAEITYDSDSNTINIAAAAT